MSEKYGETWDGLRAARDDLANRAIPTKEKPIPELAGPELYQYAAVGQLVLQNGPGILKALQSPEETTVENTPSAGGPPRNASRGGTPPKPRVAEEDESEKLNSELSGLAADGYV